MIKLRLDVDYPYPSRIKSFFFTALSIKTPVKDYLKNSKIIAKMINESPEKVKAYWFFTPYTIPDNELLNLLNSGKHEVALHVATQPYIEWKNLEGATKREVNYYTVHGTERLIARLMWRRKLWEAKAQIPIGFPLKSFYDFPTIGLDRVCYRTPPVKAVKIAEESIAKDEVLHVHPEWLFQRGTLNHRGPFYETLKTLLHVDSDLNTIAVRKKLFFKIAKNSEQYEYVRDFIPSGRFFEKLADRDIDIFTFVERKWCCPSSNLSEKWFKAKDNVALLKITSYTDWLNAIGKKTRNMIRKAEKSGIKTEVVAASEELSEGIWKIYNESPIRQGRAFSNYGISKENVRMQVFLTPYSKFIGAFLEGELVGFTQLIIGDKIVLLSQILSLQKFWDKAINNTLVAKTVEVCEANKNTWLMYGRIGNHPSLDKFKENNGFSKFPLNRYYVPISRKGLVAIKLGLHREVKDVLPKALKNPLIQVFNWGSRANVWLRDKT